jgi:hypothetical protein
MLIQMDLQMGYASVVHRLTMRNRALTSGGSGSSTPTRLPVAPVDVLDSRLTARWGAPIDLAYVARYTEGHALCCAC